MNFIKKLFTTSPPKDYQRELEILNAAIAAEPSKQKNYDQRAAAHAHLGNHKEASTDFEKALSLESNRELAELRAMELKEYKKQNRM